VISVKHPSNVWTHSLREEPGGQECWIFVRVVDRGIVLGLSRRENGDIEVALSRDDAAAVAQAISLAVDRVTPNPD